MGRVIATFCVMAVAFISLCSPCGAQQPAPAGSEPSEKVSIAAGTTEQEKESAIIRREAEEKKVRTGAFAITPHRQNYFLPVTYNNSPNKDTYVFAAEDEPNKFEVKYQISFKLLLLEKMIRGNGDLFFAYTQLSLWQLYDEALSSPFRETNYEPEMFIKFDTDFNVLGLRNRLITIGFNHESNGRGGDLSRSWNRLFAVFVAERGNFVIALKPWFRIPEDEENDDNPHIEKYMGYGELYGAYRLKKNVFSYMFRNNLRVNDNKGAVELGWSYPIHLNLRSYVQYFYGYGESLVDYNHLTNRVSVGIMLNDWL
jgi:phospholipase A1